MSCPPFVKIVSHAKCRGGAPPAGDAPPRHVRQQLPAPVSSLCSPPSAESYQKLAPEPLSSSLTASAQNDLPSAATVTVTVLPSVGVNSRSGSVTVAV